MYKNSLLSDSSIFKYVSAISTISTQMIKEKTISKEIYEMGLVELELAIFDISNNYSFIEKNKRGNHMYSNALKHYRRFLKETRYLAVEVEELLDKVKNSSLTETEKETIIKSRVGQGKYREGLIEKYNNQCLVTGIDYPRLLIASHIKPWNISDNRERIDVENGFLLSANMDRLFDNGLITFNNSGKLYVSKLISDLNKRRLSILYPKTVDLKKSRKLERYLEYHRDVIYIG